MRVRLLRTTSLASQFAQGAAMKGYFHRAACGVQRSVENA